MNDLGKITAIVAIVGFAIQQFIQLVDPGITATINYIKQIRPNHDLPGGLADADFKKAITSGLSFVLGLGVVGLTWKSEALSLLGPINGAWKGTAGDVLVTALTLGAGTEGMNTLLKYVSYVKDARKPEPSIIAIMVFPAAVSVKAAMTVQFRAQVSNSENTQVKWGVVQGNGGSIDENGGLYTAPATVGTFNVSVVSQADPTKFALAAVTVTA